MIIGIAFMDIAQIDRQRQSKTEGRSHRDEPGMWDQD